RLDLVQRWLSAIASGDSALEVELHDQLRALQAALCETQVPFHWHLEFPEVFYQERPDPLDGGQINGAAMMDAFVGNPPFLGGKRISSTFGIPFSSWLGEITQSPKNADLSAHFFRFPGEMLGAHGTIGLIATNTIGQGDTREGGLLGMLRRGHRIVDATTNMPWPGEAAVTVAIVHLAKGAPQRHCNLHLDGRSVPAISSRLRPTPERADPVSLNANTSAAYVDTYVLGLGFILTPDEATEIVQRAPEERPKISPYLGGEEVNTSPTQSFHR